MKVLGDVAIAGVTDSRDLPVSIGPQKGLAGGKDAFFGVLFPSYAGSPEFQLGYLGGTGDDAAYAVSVAPSSPLLSLWAMQSLRAPSCW